MTPSIWTGMYGHFPLHDALRALHECGWQTFEVSTEHLVEIETDRNPDSLIERAKDCVQALGLYMPQAHALLHADVAHPNQQDREQYINRLTTHMEIASRLGVKTVVIHPGGRQTGLGPDQNSAQKLNVQAFRRLGDVAGEHGMRIGIENMPDPGFANAQELLKLMQLIDHAAIGITIDTSHANMCSLNIPEMIYKFGSNLIATHISDNNGSGDQHLTPGGGNIDWPPVMQAIRNINYKGTLNLEIPGERHKVPELFRLKTEHALKVAKWLVGLRDSSKMHP